jgi:hypothetical protein
LQERKPAIGYSVDPHRYHSYPLRLWREAPAAAWRCQVSCVGTGVDDVPLKLHHVEPGVTGLAELDRVASDEQKGT